MDDIDTETQPAPTFPRDRPSRRTPDERLEHFEHWWDRYGKPYEKATIENGDEPWSTDVAERRALFMRRYIRPSPPPLNLTNDLNLIRNGIPAKNIARNAA
jgi:hypothetical protein